MPIPQTFHAKYRIASARHPTWDYGSNAAYFVTICTKNRVPYFGHIGANDVVCNNDPLHTTIDYTRMHTTPLGDASRRCWAMIPSHFPFVRLNVFVVMPDHMHGIIVIDKHNDTDDHGDEDVTDATWTPNRFGPQSHNLGSIIRGFKIGVTKFAKENDVDFCWQPRFHDRIIRNDGSMQRIRTYIASNPQHWLKDVKKNVKA